MAKQHYHLVGVAGVGMSALALALRDAGFDVSGSDRDHDAGRDVPVLEQLVLAGVRLVPQDGRVLTRDSAALVVSTAIEGDNPDVQAAAQLGVPQKHRSELLWMLASQRRCLAVAGTSGKSTVTGMIGHILAEAGLDPMVVNGAPLLNWQTAERIGNFRSGSGEWCVIEADESDRSLLRFRPERAVIINASADHFDLAETEQLFETFASQVKDDVVEAWRDPQVFAPRDVICSRNGLSFRYADTAVTMPVMGAHNAGNAAVAMEVCVRLGVSAQTAAKALSNFRGIHRRLERVGQAGGIAVYDDYSHNPAKIAAACSALVPFYERVHVVWRPHGYGPLRNMMKLLVEAFGQVLRADDTLCVLPVYDVGGTTDRSITHVDFVAAAAAAGLKASCCDHYDAVEAVIRTRAQPDHAVLVMGARDPFLPALAKQLLSACV